MLRVRPWSYCAISVVALLCACTVGPNFSPPEAPPTQQYTPATEPTEPIDAGPNAVRQTLTPGDTIATDWRTPFQPPPPPQLVPAPIPPTRRTPPPPPTP